MYKYNFSYPLGITVIGSLSAITAIFLLAGIFAYLIYFEQMWPNFCAKIYFDLSHPTEIAEKVKTCMEFQPVTNKICITGIVYLALFVACSVVLIIGGMKRNKAFMFPYQVTLIVITLLTVMLCSYVARYSPYEMKVLMGFCCVFMTIMTMACCFAVGRHIHQIQLADLLLIGKQAKLDESFDSGLKSVLVKGNVHPKRAVTKLPSISEQIESPIKTQTINEVNSGKKSRFDSLFLVEQSILSVSNTTITDKPIDITTLNRQFEGISDAVTIVKPNEHILNRLDPVALTKGKAEKASMSEPVALSVSNKSADSKLDQITAASKRTSITSSKHLTTASSFRNRSASVPKFRSVRKNDRSEQNKLKIKRNNASATIIQSLVFDQNTI